MPQPPKCKVCGVAEWRHTCSGYTKYDDRPEAEFVTPAVTPTVTKLVTVTRPVTRPTHVTRTVTPADDEVTGEVKRLTLALTMATEEIAHLKRMLAEANGGKAPMTAAERQRKRREAAKAKQGG